MRTHHDESLVFTVPEAARLLGLSRNGGYEAARRGDIPTVRIGGRILVPRVALLRMLEVPDAKVIATTVEKSSGNPRDGGRR
jgi:excisionase family DNA binding protein